MADVSRDRDRRPLKPAAAYHHMVSVLPGWYFATPPPHTGLLVHVRAGDGCWTQWAMAPNLCESVKVALRSRPVRFKVEPYTGRTS